MTDRTRGILFDLDGVLIDSPKAHVDAWNRMLKPFGVQVPPERLHRVEGMRAEEIAAGIIAEYRLVIPVDELDRLLILKREDYRRNAPRSLREDAKSAILEFKAIGWKVALVSGSARANAVHAIPPDEITLFDALITAEEYQRAKPDPEPYITGCQRLGVLPSESIAVENAPLGIASAKTAGLRVVALTSTLPAEELVGADVVVETLTDLIRLVGVVRHFA